MSSSRTILHKYHTTFLLFIVPLFILIGGLLITLSVVLYLWLRPTEPGLLVSMGLAMFFGLALPVSGVLMFFLLPKITTALDPERKLVEVEYTRPLWTSIKQYPFSEIAEVRAVYVGDRSYGLALILRSGVKVRLEYSSTSNIADRQRVAANIMAQLAPYVSRGEVS